MNLSFDVIASGSISMTSAVMIDMQLLDIIGVQNNSYCSVGTVVIHITCLLPRLVVTTVKCGMPFLFFCLNLYRCVR